MRFAKGGKGENRGRILHGAESESVPISYE
jgi:hypothetical protein